LLKKTLSFCLLIAMLLQFFPVLSLRAEGASYTTSDWTALINNYKRELCGDSSVDYTDPDVQAIVNKKNASGVTTAGIGYTGWNNWQDLESNRSNANRIFGTADIIPSKIHTSKW
jgi:hypothetical protein